MNTIQVFSMNRKPVQGARFEINGLKARPQHEGVYAFDSLPPPPYHIKIAAKGFISAEYSGINTLPGELFLLRKGDDYYYESWYKIPCVPSRNFLLVTMFENDAAGHSLSPESTRKQLEEWASAHQLVIALSYADKMKNAIVAKGESPSPYWKHTFLLCRSDQRPFDDSSSVLAALRSEKGVRFAGPLISFDKDHRQVISYKPQVTVSFVDTLGQEKALQLLDSLGYGKAVVNTMAGTFSLTLQLPLSTGMEMNRIVERLQRLPGIRTISPATWIIR